MSVQLKARETRDNTSQQSEDPDRTGERMTEGPTFPEERNFEVPANDGSPDLTGSQTDLSETGSVKPDPAFQPIYQYPTFGRITESFQVLQKWKGYVLSVNDDTFEARLTPIKGQGEDQKAEIYREQIDEPDQELIEEGAEFYWSIGYLDKPSGRVKASKIRFRRLPAVTKSDLEQAREEADELKTSLDVS